MDLNIEEEISKVIEIMNDDCIDRRYFRYDINANYGYNKYLFLCSILLITKKYPQLETYLEDVLLPAFTVIELENHSIVKMALRESPNISYNSLKLVINSCLNLNSKCYDYLNLFNSFSQYCNSLSIKEFIDITNLLLERGVNLNALNMCNKTALDIMTHLFVLNEQIEPYIIILLDLGAKTNNPDSNNLQMIEFIQSYTCQNIKVAIKNENKN